MGELSEGGEAAVEVVDDVEVLPAEVARVGAVVHGGDDLRQEDEQLKAEPCGGQSFGWRVGTVQCSD
jgi:hypothetical protein